MKLNRKIGIGILIFLAVAVLMAGAVEAATFKEVVNKKVYVNTIAGETKDAGFIAKMILYPKAFFKTPRVLVNALLLAAILIFIVIYTDVGKGDAKKQYALYTIFGLAAIFIAWQFGVKHSGLYIWQYEAIANFFHLRVIVNIAIIAAAIFVVGQFMSPDFKTNLSSPGFGSASLIILVLIVAAMVAEMPTSVA